MTKIYKSLFLILILGVSINSTQGQELSTLGKTFWLTFMENNRTNTDSAVAPELKIVISCNKATSGTVKNPITNHSFNFSIGAGGGVDTVYIPGYMGYCYNSEFRSKRDRGLLVEALDTVAVSAQSSKQYSCDAALIYPIEALGVDYRVLSYLGDPSSGFGSSPNYRSAFAIVATENGTTVEITPSCQTANGVAAGTKITVVLQKGQTYQVRAGTNKLDLSGTLVQSLDCKKIALFAGSSRSAIGPPGSSCASSYDHLYEQMMPINTWGKKFIVAPTIWSKSRLRRYELIKVVANANSTVVRFNNRPVKILAAGASDTFWMDSSKCKNAYISSNKPIGVCQYASSEACDGGGFGGGTDTDPMMMWIPAIEQSLKNLNFSCENAQTINKFFLNVIVKTSTRKSFLLDGAPPSNGWRLISNDTSYSYLQQHGLTLGSHNINSPYGFSAILYAYGDHGSYGYNAGSSVKPLSFYMTAGGKSSADFELDTPYFIVCQGAAVPFDVTASYAVPSGGYKWLINTPSGLITKTSKFFTQTFNDTGFMMVRAITTRPPSGVCNGISTDTLTQYVKVFAKPKIRLLKDTTICRGNSFYLTSKTDGDTNYTFSPATWLSCTKCFMPLVSPLMDTTYTVVATTKGCQPSRDTFKVKIRDSLFLFKSNDTTICRGTSTTLTAWAQGGLQTGQTLTWDNGLGIGLNKVVAPKVTTTYRVILTDGCTRDSAKNYYADTAYIKVTVYDSLKMTMPNDTIVCEGNSVTMTPTVKGGRPGTSLLTWDNSLGIGFTKTVTMGTTTTTYKAVLSDGCTNPEDSGYMTITVRPGLKIDTIMYPDPVCRNSVFKVNLKLSGGDSTGYIVKLLNTTISGPPVLIDSSKGTAYPSFDMSIPDDSKFRVSFTQTCNSANSALKGFNVKIKNALSIVSTLPVDTICTGQSYDIKATGSNPENIPIKFVLKRKNGTAYLPIDSMTAVTNASFKVTPTATQTDYMIIGDDQCNRTDSSYFRLMVRAPLVLTTTLTDVELCRNQSTSFTAFPADGKVQDITYTWTEVGSGNLLGNTKMVSITPLNSMDINLKVDDGCSIGVSDVVRIYVAPEVTDAVLAVDTAGCEPFATTFSYPTTNAQTINPSFNWYWYFGASSNLVFSTSTPSVGGQTHSSIVKNYNSAGTYAGKVELKLNNGTVCNTYQQNVEVWPQAVADFDYSPVVIDIVEPLVTFINQSTGATKYTWDFGDIYPLDYTMNPQHSYDDTGYYTVTLIAGTDNGCDDTTYKRLQVLDIYRIWIPEAFSPNEDNYNNVWLPKATSIQKMEFEIFNRWGEKVFEGNENTPWGGQYGNVFGNICPEGVYYYHISVRDNRKKWHYYNGTLTLIK